MSQLPGFSRIPPEPLSKEEVTSTLLSIDSFCMNEDIAELYLKYPYDPSIYIRENDNGEHFICFFEKENYSVLDLTTVYSYRLLDSVLSRSIFGIKLDSTFTKDVFIQKLVLCRMNRSYANQPIFEIPSNVHVKTIELKDSTILNIGMISGLEPAEFIFPDCYLYDPSPTYNEETDSLVCSFNGIPVRIKNSNFGGTHYFVESGGMSDDLMILDKYYQKEFIRINKSTQQLILRELHDFYLEDNFIGLNTMGEILPVDTFVMQNCLNISLPSFIKKIVENTVLYGYLDISRCLEFQLDTLNNIMESTYGTIYVNTNQFSEMQASNLIVQRAGEDFYVLSAYADQTERENYVKVVVKSE